jgi:hypothetical protein
LPVSVTIDGRATVGPSEVTFTSEGVGAFRRTPSPEAFFVDDSLRGSCDVTVFESLSGLNTDTRVDIEHDGETRFIELSDRKERPLLSCDFEECAVFDNKRASLF